MATPTGIEHLIQLQRQQHDRQVARARNDLYNKLFGLIKSIPGKGTTEHSEFCTRLITMPNTEDQKQAILEAYGSVCLTKVEHILYQLASMTK